MKTKHHSILSAPVIQSGGKRLNNTIHRKWSVLALSGFLFTSIFAVLPSPVEAACPQGWDVGHGWRFKQGSLNVDLDLHQKGSVITGTAQFYGIIKKGEGGISGAFGESGFIRGTVSGIVKGDHLAMKIYWNNNTNGVYDGTIRSTGIIEGTGYNEATPSTKVNWASETRMQCAAKASGTALSPIRAPGPDDYKKLQNEVNKAAATKNTGPEQTRGVVPGPNDYKKLQDEVNKAAATPTPSPEAEQSSSSDTEDQPQKHKKKHKRHHHDDDENQGNG